MSLGFMRPAHQARLERFVELARVYRGWSRVQLADRLGRDPSHIVPVAGNAKLSFLRRIADALDWDLRDVVDSLASVERSAGGVARNSARNAVDERGLGRLSEDPEVDTDTPEDAVGVAGLETLLQRAAAASRTSLIESRRWEADERARQPPKRGESFQELDRSALAAHRAGQVDDLLTIIEAMRVVAASPTERAITANREIGAWDLRGRYAQALEAAHAGLAEEGVSPSVQTMLQANLAHVHMTLWHLVEAQAVASDVIQRCDAVESASTASEGEGRVARVAGAFARFVRGAALCRAIDHEVAPGRRHLAERARADLADAVTRYDTLARGVGDGHLAAMAHSCHAVILECEAALDRVDPVEAVHAVIERLGEAQDLGNVPGGEWLESFGWWAISGCTIALRHLDGHELHRTMAVCTNKALEIADRLDHWALRERAFTMERFRRQRIEDATGCEPEWLLDEEDVRVLAGTMGRFPKFRAAGWRILESARLFDGADDDVVAPGGWTMRGAIPRLTTLQAGTQESRTSVERGSASPPRRAGESIIAPLPNGSPPNARPGAAIRSSNGTSAEAAPSVTPIRARARARADPSTKPPSVM